MSDIVDRLKAVGKPMALDDRVWNTITVSSGASIFDEAASTITALQERVKVLERAGRDIKPYLEWTIGPESPGYHPTMPSAVGAFLEVHALTALEQKQ